MRKVIFSILLFTFLSSSVFALTCTSGSGSYASWVATPWTCTPGPTAGPPGCSDAIIITGTIDMSDDVDFSGCPSPMVITITSTGKLVFGVGGIRLKLPEGSSVLIHVGGMIDVTFTGAGSSTLITSGTGGSSVNLWTAGTGDIVPTAGTGTITLGPSPLPIELTRFTANPCEKEVCIDWTTLSEMNNDFFTIEKSKNGSSFETAGIIDGAGNSTVIRNYSFVDKNPYNDVSYYRLKQTDFNGDFSYSKLEMVDLNSMNDFTINVFPNPNDGDNISISINANLGEEILVVAYDGMCREVYSKVLITTNDGENITAFDPSGKLSSGIYLITATSNQKICSKKMIVK